LGSWFVSEAGEKQLEEGLKYSAKFEEISKYAEDPQCNVTPIMKMSYGYVEYGDETVKVANAGHPFVLISHDKTLVETS
jgi:serine phosphatase RsbU (regulator of sigma subunit)